MGQKQPPKFKDASTFSNDVAFLSQFSDESQILNEYKDVEPTDFLHSGHFLLNAHISGSMRKGYMNNKIYTIAGDPKTGKSHLVFNAMKNFQDSGYTPYYFETENALDKNRLVDYGIDLDRCLLEQPEVVDDIIIPLTRMTDKMLALQKSGKPIPKVAVFIDSLTGLNSSKQYSDAMVGAAKQDMGTVAKDLKRMFNMLAVRCGKLMIPIICTTHVYEKDMGNFRKRTATGGSGAQFMSSVVMMLKKKDEKDAETRQRTGILVTSEIVETRYSNPIDITFYLGFKKGMNPYFGLQQYLSWEACGICKGKMVDFVDLAGELISKGVLQKAIINTKKLSSNDIKKNLSKAKAESLKAQIIWHLDNGYLNANDDNTYTFTDKAKDNWGGDGWNKIDIGKVHFPNPTSTHWIARHLGESFPTSELFSKKVFSDDVIKQLDEKVIIPLFQFEKEDISGDKIMQDEKDAADSLESFFNQVEE